ncbi:DUF159-domain-containing protein [Laetiporus sulphureus 93-53]|uniref:DUF159-domain-containing protein n=1 Tax=Laetiporus sulphureus 93-53 TaxID=1314785 RepID=A0A165CRX6_9APHY|nr:DUF159-domain-containing protein [Laetiporus sulphureus 93-53]KZT03329.1 DUF159-domain-containing protein [Laetiporus sulphureus 93-53]
MCGRYSLNLSHAEIQQLHGYNVHVGEWIGQDQFVPRYNIAPRSQAPVLRRREPSENSEDGQSDELILQTMKWGLVPHWSKHEQFSYSTFNARYEAVVEGTGIWASIRGKRRCAVICEGYYEWQKKGNERLPHFMKHKNGHLMLLAGLYDKSFVEEESEPLWTFTVITTDATKNFQWLHDRQPVILPSLEALNTWLDTSSQKWSDDLTKLVQPYHYPDYPLECYQVPKEVGKVGNESPSFIQPIGARKDGIEAMFARQKQITSSPGKGKRKRSTSPVMPVTPTKHKSAAKKSHTKPETERTNAEYEHTDVESSGQPSTSVYEETTSEAEEKPAGSPHSSHARQAAKPSKKPRLERRPSSNKTTGFFKKT